MAYPENQKRIVAALMNAPVGDGNISKGKIKVAVSDPHTQNLIERMVEEKKGILDKTFSSKVLVLNAEQFLEIVVDIYGNGAEDSYERTILAIKREAREIRDELTKENIIEKFRDAFQKRPLVE